MPCPLHGQHQPRAKDAFESGTLAGLRFYALFLWRSDDLLGPEVISMHSFYALFIWRTDDLWGLEVLSLHTFTFERIYQCATCVVHVAQRAQWRA